MDQKAQAMANFLEAAAKYGEKLIDRRFFAVEQLFNVRSEMYRLHMEFESAYNKYKEEVVKSLSVAQPATAASASAVPPVHETFLQKSAGNVDNLLKKIPTEARKFINLFEEKK